jgi:integrase/recombinase XerD
MRSNTLLNLKVDDVNINEGTIALNTTKAHKTIILHLDSKAKIELKQYINKYRADEDDEYLFISDYNEQLTRQGLSKAIANYNKRRGVEKTSIHLFRHTFAKNWITSGGDIITLAKVLTHSELEMVKRYSNLYDTDLKDKMKEHSTLSQMKTKSGKTMRTTRGGKE